MRERVAIMRENVRWVVTSAPDWFSHLSEVGVRGGSADENTFDLPLGLLCQVSPPHYKDTLDDPPSQPPST